MFHMLYYHVMRYSPASLRASVSMTMNRAAHVIPSAVVNAYRYSLLRALIPRALTVNTTARSIAIDGIVASLEGSTESLAAARFTVTDISDVSIGMVVSGITLARYGLKSVSIARGILQLIAGSILLVGGAYTLWLVVT